MWYLLCRGDSGGICYEYGIVLIFDEVMTGFGRTGEWFTVGANQEIEIRQLSVGGLLRFVPTYTIIGRLEYENRSIQDVGRIRLLTGRALQRILVGMGYGLETLCSCHIPSCLS